MGTTRESLHLVSAHVLGRRRFDVSGRFGLRASPAGIATPAFGPEPEVVRLSGAMLVREVGAESSMRAVDGATVAELAAFAGADLTSDFSAGTGMPDLGDVHAPLHVDAAEARALYDWYDLGWQVLDALIAERDLTASTLQLWPEHFDMGTTVDLASGQVNLGFSPGDGYSVEPYVYVGPWDAARPGSAEYWNAPFGAAAPRSLAPDAASCEGFLIAGLDQLAATTG
jgi:hypothetical protein